YPIVAGAKLKVKDGEVVKSGQMLAEWDPYTIPVLTEASGAVKYGDLIDGVTIRDELDERTGLSNTVVIDYTATQTPVVESRASKKKGAKEETASTQLTPRISVKGPDGKTVKFQSGQEARYQLPVGIHIHVADGQEVM